LQLAEQIAREVLGKSIRVVSYDKNHGHLVAYDGTSKIYIVYTTRTLRNSGAVFGKDFGEMLGVRTSILMQSYDYIMWVVNRGSKIDVYMDRSNKVHSFCTENSTVYRNRETGEYICNYPAALAKHVETITLHRTLDSYEKK
jgi:hypothetical protein